MFCGPDSWASTEGWLDASDEGSITERLRALFLSGMINLVIIIMQPLLVLQGQQQERTLKTH